MGKKSKNKQESGSKLSAAAIAATAVIALLAGEANITLTDKNAVLKDLRPDARAKTEQVHRYTRWGVNTEGERALYVLSLDDVHRYTRWGVNAEGERVLVVLNSDGTAIKAYEDYATKYPSMRTLHS